MSKTADADHTHAVRRLYARQHDWIKYRNTGTKERPGFCRVDLFGQRNRPDPMTADAIRESAVAIDKRLFRLRAKMLVAGQTWAAVQATRGIPAQPNALAHAHILRAITRGDDLPYDFMSRHERIRTFVPFIIDHGDIG